MHTQRPRFVVPKPTLLACALAGCLALGAPSAFAQSTGATLRGDAAGGAEITATNTETGLVRRVTAASDGSYTLANLPPGTYDIECFVPDDQTGMPHIVMGMHKIVILK